MFLEKDFCWNKRLFLTFQVKTVSNGNVSDEDIKLFQTVLDVEILLRLIRDENQNHIR